MPAHRNSELTDLKWILVVLSLSWVSGSLDAISYLRLGHVFVANMTGNTVLLSMALGQGDFAAALRSAFAILGYVCGVVVGTLVIDRARNARQADRAVRPAIIFEAFALVSFASVSYLASGEKRGILFFLICLSGVAMGIQSASVRKFDLPGIVTTYITGTITTLTTGTVRLLRHTGIVPTRVEEAHPQIDWEHRMELQVGVLLAYGVSAVISTLLARSSSFPAMFSPVLALAFVVAMLFLPGHNPKAAVE